MQQASRERERERDRGRKGKGIKVFAKNRQVRERLRINGMKRSKKKENAGKSSCSQFVERQLHKHRGAFKDNQTMTKNKSHIKDQHQFPNYLRKPRRLNQI